LIEGESKDPTRLNTLLCNITLECFIISVIILVACQDVSK
jgi:hypothetical protein